MRRGKKKKQEKKERRTEVKFKKVERCKTYVSGKPDMCSRAKSENGEGSENIASTRLFGRFSREIKLLITIESR